MTYIFRKAHTRGEKGHNGKSLTSLTSLTELDHDWQAQHPRRDRGTSKLQNLPGTKSGRGWQAYAHRPEHFRA